MFSIVIPLYNKEFSIQRAIHSILSQSYQHFELIIIDDGSTDNSYEIAASINDARISIIRQENQGVSAARNRGIENAENDWIAFLDADDEWNTEFLKDIYKLHTNYPSCGLWATGYLKMRSTGLDYCEFRKIRYPDDWEGILQDYYTDLREVVPFCCSSFVVNKSILIQAGGFPNGMTVGEDINTWIRLYQITKFAYLKRADAIYHLDAESHSNRPFADIFSGPKDISNGDLLRQVLRNKKVSDGQFTPITELLAMYDIPVIRKLIQNGYRWDALKRLWSFRMTKTYKKKWLALFAKCFLPVDLTKNT